MEKKNSMETFRFFIDDKFYSSVAEYAEDLELEMTDEEIKALPDDWKKTVFIAEKRPVVQLSANWICDRLDDDNLSEDGDEVEAIHKLIKEKLNFDEINSLMPCLWYATRMKGEITKKHLLAVL